MGQYNAEQRLVVDSAGIRYRALTGQEFVELCKARGEAILQYATTETYLVRGDTAVLRDGFDRYATRATKSQLDRWGAQGLSDDFRAVVREKDTIYPEWGEVCP